jgi:alpha-galactosidase
MHVRLTALTVLVLWAGWDLAARGADRRVEAGDAFVEADRNGGRWSIGSSQVQMDLAVTPAGELRLGGLRAPTGPNLARSTQADGLVTVDGQTGPLGSAASGFVVTGVEPSTGNGFAEVQVRLKNERGPVIATRHYRARPGVAALEVWTDFAVAGDAPARVQDLSALAMTVPAGHVHWVSGLDAEGGPFTRHARELVPGESLTLGSPIVSSSHVVPYVAIAGAEGAFFAALAWSGTWSAFVERTDEGLAVRLGLPEMSALVRPGDRVEGPHALVGVVPGDEHAASAAVQQAVMAGRSAFPSWSTFNSWFAYGTRIDAANMRDAIDQSSRAGIELLQLDAGWYPQPRPTSVWDFTDGLGSWEVDRERFPGGLGPIGDYARAQGMRFGVWVEPERVALATVGQPGLAEERFLATTAGAYDPGRRNDETTDGQICLGDRAAREWVLARLTAFIEDTRPDYLKWDYNRWLICDRPDHDHPADGGSFAHVRGLYSLLEAVRQRFPSLIVENCSSGGHRLDLGLARLTDTGWMDDMTAPSSRVRHNLEGLTAMLPAGYLLSYVMPHEDEPMSAATDMPGLARSRMMGTLGVAVNFRTVSERDVNQLAQEVRLAHVLREYQAGASTYLLSAQAGARPAFEVVQQWSAARERGVLWVYQRDTEQPRVQVRLRGLDPGRVYELRQVDSNRRERASGATLLDTGIELRATQESAAQVFTIEAVGGSAARVR